MAKKKKSKYGSLRNSVSAGREQLDKGSGSGALSVGDIPFWEPEKGNNLFDVIPFVVGKGNFLPSKRRPEGELFQQIFYRIHFNVGPDNKTVACPTSIGEPCPICERWAELKKDRDADEEELKELKAKDRVAFNIIDLNNEKAGIQVFDMSPYRFAHILYEETAAREGTDDDVSTVFDLDEGYTIKARFAPKSIAGGKPFLECTRVDFEERDPYDDEIVEEAVDLSSALNILSYDALEALFLGMPVEEEEEDPAPRRGRSRRDEDPEEEEEKPKRGRGRRKTEPEEEPEPEAEPEREEEEETNSDEGCPHGMEFGTDCESDDVCDDCEVWKDCRDAQKAAKSGGRRRR